jgi:Putative beta barrel porin-7 (BBP7)
MRWSITRGLCLALGLFVARAHADETDWRPACPRPVAQTAPAVAPASAFVTLQRPLPLTNAPSGDASAPVTPVFFQAITDDAPRPLVRAQRADAAQPLPPGPVLGSPEVLGPPRPVPSGSGKAPASSDPDIVSRWIGGSPDLLGSGSPVIVGSGGCACGPVGCDPCGPVCCDPCGPSCCDNSCCGAGCCKDRGSFWFGGEYLLWAIRRDNLPPLVTVNPTGALPSVTTPGTIVTFGNGNLDTSPFSGGRVYGGFWCSECSDLGFEANGFLLAQRSTSYTAGPSGISTVGRPLDIQNQLNLAGVLIANGPSAELVVAPGLAGTVSVTTQSQLWGAEVNGRYKMFCGDGWHMDFLAGLRYVELRESIDITENLATTAAGLLPNGALLVPGGTSFVVADHFSTRNQFGGGQIGLDFEYRWRRWFVDTSLKVAVGDQHETVQIQGNTILTVPGLLPIAANGGLLALASNIGTFTRDRLAVVPEVGLKIGYDVTDHMRLYAGYNLLAISDTVRPGSQIDLRVNTNQLPFTQGVIPPLANSQPMIPALPAVLFRETGFWAQGLTAGLEFHY